MSGRKTGRSWNVLSSEPLPEIRSGLVGIADSLTSASAHGANAKTPARPHRVDTIHPYEK
jgi:hypothetical protein